MVLRHRLLPDYALDDCLDDLEAATRIVRKLRPGAACSPVMGNSLTAQDDGQSHISYDPPGCYYESYKLKFGNPGSTDL